MTKKCSKCKIVLSVSKFYKDSSKSDGLHSQCKFCIKAYRTTRRERNNKIHRKWYCKNKEEEKARTKK